MTTKVLYKRPNEWSKTACKYFLLVQFDKRYAVTEFVGFVIQLTSFISTFSNTFFCIDLLTSDALKQLQLDYQGGKRNTAVLLACL